MFLLKENKVTRLAFRFYHFFTSRSWSWLCFALWAPKFCRVGVCKEPDSVQGSLREFNSVSFSPRVTHWQCKLQNWHCTIRIVYLHLLPPTRFTGFQSFYCTYIWLVTKSCSSHPKRTNTPSYCIQQSVWLSVSTVVVWTGCPDKTYNQMKYNYEMSNEHGKSLVIKISWKTLDETYLLVNPVLFSKFCGTAPPSSLPCKNLDTWKKQ